MHPHPPHRQRILFIGSSVADVILQTPALPVTGDDINLTSQTAALGGCACNAYRISRMAGADAVLFSPVGQGIWGDFVRQQMAQEKIVTLCPSSEESNGCCYCLVEPSGERTFLCDHGAEYHFLPSWFDVLGDEVFHSAFICGLEMEAPTGSVILDYLEQHPVSQLYFAPGPRILHIHPKTMARIIQMNPVIHMNLTELLSFTLSTSLTQGIDQMLSLGECSLVITLGSDGAYFADSSHRFQIPGAMTEVADTIGAGDAHAGGLMAARWKGLEWDSSLSIANIFGAAVVSVPGAKLSSEQFQSWLLRHPDSEKELTDF